MLKIHWPALLILLNTGCRLSEAIALTASSIDLQTDEVVFRILKRRKVHFRSVPLSPAMMTQLKLVHNLSKRQQDQKLEFLPPYSPDIEQYRAYMGASKGDTPKRTMRY